MTFDLTFELTFDLKHNSVCVFYHPGYLIFQKKNKGQKI